MKWFANLKISVKLIAAFVCVALIAGGVGLLGIQNMNTINLLLNSMYDNNLVPITDIANANMQAIYHNRAVYDYLIEPEQTGMDGIAQKIKSYETQMQELLDAYRKTTLTDAEEELLAKLDAAWPKYIANVEKVLPLSYAGRNEEAIDLMNGETTTTFQVVDDLFTELVDLNAKLSKQAYDESDVIYGNSRQFMLIFTGAAFALALGFGIFIARGINTPLQKIVHLIKAMQQGDLGVVVDVNQNDEIGVLADATRAMVANLQNTAQKADQIASGDLTAQVTILSDKDTLGQSLDAMLKKLREVVSDVQGATENVSSGSEAMSSGSEEMSNGATEQAAASEEASSSMEQMAANIRQNADNATQTEKIAAKAADDAQKSGEAVAQTVTAMREIVRKITIIEEIARQTHTLSLNATIEAAKAEQYGKGFAVVAAEVRALASRAQDASSEINQMASQSIDVAERAGEMLTKLVPDIEKTAELVQEIGAASREQSSGTEQINRAIQQLDSVTQQNSSISEEMASTAEELASQAEQLQHTIAFFTVGEIDRQRPTANVHAQPKKLTVAHLNQRAKAQSSLGNHKNQNPPAEGIDARDKGPADDDRDAEFERF